MKRVVLAIRNRLVLEAVTNALKRAGFFVEKSSSQETERILTLTNALAATTLVMDVTRSGDGTFDMRMDTVREVRRQNPEIKIALLCDNVSDESSAYKVKCAKEDGSIDAFFYESVPSDHNLDALCSAAHYAAHSLLHRSAERRSLFKLLSDGFGDEHRVHVGALYFENVDVNGACLDNLAKLLLELLDACALGADKHTGLGGVNVNHYLVLSALDSDLGDAEGVILLLDVLANLVVLENVFGKVFLICIPLSVPAGDDAHSQSVRIDLLSHIT